MTDVACITAITADPREPDLRRIQAAGRCVARIRHVDVDAMRLRVGDPLNASLLAGLEAADRRAALRVRAIRSLSRAAASRKKLESRLARHGTEDDIAQVLDNLTADGIVDDVLAAAQLVTETLRREPVGRTKLLQMLTSRGFGQDVSERVVDDALRDRDGRQDLSEAATRAARGLHGLPRDTAARRLAGRLGRRGFDEDAVAEAIRSILPEE